MTHPACKNTCIQHAQTDVSSTCSHPEVCVLSSGCNHGVHSKVLLGQSMQQLI